MCQELTASLAWRSFSLSVLSRCCSALSPRLFSCSDTYLQTSARKIMYLLQNLQDVDLVWNKNLNASFRLSYLSKLKKGCKPITVYKELYNRKTFTSAINNIYEETLTILLTRAMSSSSSFCLWRKWASIRDCSSVKSFSWRFLWISWERELKTHTHTHTHTQTIQVTGGLKMREMCV